MKKILLALISVSLLTACGADSTTSDEKKEEAPAAEESAVETQEESVEETEEPKEEEAKVDYEVTDIALDETGYTPAVTGILKNTSGSEMNYVQIEFPIKDADGNKLGTAISNMNGLKDGETWKFTAQSLVTDEGQQIDLENYEVSGF